jgi:DNA topoisomerase-1
MEVDDSIASARAARLHYVSDAAPGMRRRRQGSSFAYLDPGGRPVKDRTTIDRIRRLAIPPAWTDVWICPDPLGHIQATGRDARGRKQYRYHARWRTVRDAAKYERMADFGKALPRIRQRVQQDLGKPGLPREKVLAAVVRLLEETHIRVGNEEYARENGSFGLTTLRNHHADVNGSSVRFSFKGKSGRLHRVEFADHRLARIIRQTQDLPGQELFQYVDDDGAVIPVGSEDVNEYLREISADDFTAKDFRTWAGTILAARYFADCGHDTPAGKARQEVVRTIARVADALGNTPAVCRKCYVHPAVVAAFLEGTLGSANGHGRNGRHPANGSSRGAGLAPEERRLLTLLRSV